MSEDSAALMKRGLALLAESTPASLAEAVGLFEGAIALRQAALAPGDHRAAYLAAASWMNRGDALTRLGGPARLAEAVRSYDEALLVLRAVPPEADPLYRRRWALAWMNRGCSLQEQGTAESLAAALASFDGAIGTVREHPEHAPILASAWVNRGKALLLTLPPRAVEAHAAASAALALVAEQEEHDALAAETGLKARALACQALAELIESDPARADRPELLGAATDAMEEGLRLARGWGGRGERHFGSLARWLFHFGLAAYGAHQPHFLAEFVLENLAPAGGGSSLAQDPEAHRLATRALAGAVAERDRAGFVSLRAPGFDGLPETLQALRLTQERLGDLHALRPDKS